MSEKQLATTVKTLVSSDAMKSRFAEVMRDKAPAFLASVASQSASGPLANVDPRTVIAAAFVAATLNLPVDRNLGFAWIVPYKGQAAFQMGYKGYIQLAQRSGQYQRMNAFCVNQEALGGFDDCGEPIVDHSKLDPDKPTVGYCFVFKLCNGFTKQAYWSRAAVEKHAKRYSQSFGKGSSSPWTTNFDQMALKTVIAHTLRTWGPLSAELQTSLRHDGGSMKHIDAEEVSYPDNESVAEIVAGQVGANPLEDKPAEPKVVAATEVTPTEKVEDEAFHAQARIAALCKKAGISRSRLIGHLVETKFLPEGSVFEKLTEASCKVILADWETISDAVIGIKS